MAVPTATTIPASVGSVVGNVVPLREVTHDKPYFEQLSLTIVKFVTVM
jgi:hypothetical protein